MNKKYNTDNLRADIQFLVNMSGDFGAVLLEELQEIADYIKALEAENENALENRQKIDYYAGYPMVIHRNGETFYNLERLHELILK